MILTTVKNEIGATAIEYGLIASLIGVLAVGGMSAVGVNLSNTYCTISKHLGGAGECSGSGSSGTGGDGSSTGSEENTSNTSLGINDTNSLAKGAAIDQVFEGLTDELDFSLVPQSMGGNGHGIVNINFGDTFGSENLKNMSYNMNKINASDPITNVFGIYDSSTHNPITDYNQVNDALQKGGSNINADDSWVSSKIMQITTTSGKVYSINSNGHTTEHTQK